jgi:hypothetical protein
MEFTSSWWTQLLGDLNKVYVVFSTTKYTGFYRLDAQSTTKYAAAQRERNSFLFFLHMEATCVLVSYGVTGYATSKTSPAGCERSWWKAAFLVSQDTGLCKCQRVTRRLRTPLAVGTSLGICATDLASGCNADRL